MEMTTGQRFSIEIDASLAGSLAEPIPEFGEPDAVALLLRDMIADGMMVRGCLRDWEQGLELIRVSPTN
jgi:hypothetical protein